MLARLGVLILVVGFLAFQAHAHNKRVHAVSPFVIPVLILYQWDISIMPHFRMGDCLGLGELGAVRSVPMP